ncbi:MAG: metallophosphoesterase [Chloroflexota bacterium]|nr:metallophosphoesterase family protein [Anaerolineae bacterium]
MLEIGARGTLTVRHLHFSVSSPKTSLLYASDLHLSRQTEHIVQQLIGVVQSTQPAVVLLGGDMVDSKSAFAELTTLIQGIKVICPVWAISGNHESYVGVDSVRECVEAAQSHWLNETSFSLSPTVRIDGTCQPSADPDVFSILCAHEPDVFPQAVRAGYKLVLAGHLHGSQFVLTQFRGRLFPGAWFFRWNGDIFHQDNCTMIVSRGANDTMPIRWNCPREVIVCSIGEA